MRIKLQNIIVQFLKFGIVGMINTLLSYGIYSIGILAGLDYFVCNTISLIITVYISFILNSKYVFHRQFNRHEYIRALGKVYFSYAGTSWILSSFLLWIQIEKWGVNELVAPIFSLCITVPINFVANKFWTYRRKKENE